MARVVEAIYENGTLKRLETLDLPEHQRVRITIHEPIVASPEETLEAWHPDRRHIPEAESDHGDRKRASFSQVCGAR